MKRFIVFLIGLLVSFVAYSQAYRGITIADPPEQVQVLSFQGISVDSISYDPKDGYSVTLTNTNYNNSGERNKYCFDWYLSFKGKRVSDYYSSSIYCRRSITYNRIFTWPNSVPTGNEKYVTVQFRRDNLRDSRDDE